MGRTNIVLDDRLVEQAMKLSGAKTKKQVVDLALRTLVARGSAYRALRRLRGRLAWHGDIEAWRRSRS